MLGSDYVFILIDANARTGVRIGEKGFIVFGGYGRGTLVSNSNGTSLFRFSGDNMLALANTFFAVPRGFTFRALTATQPVDKKRLEYIITRQPHSKLVRYVSVHMQPRTDSDQNIVGAPVQLPGRLAHNKKQRAPTGRKSIDR